MLQENDYSLNSTKEVPETPSAERKSYLNPATYKHSCTENISTQILTLILIFLLPKIETLSQFMGHTWDAVYFKSFQAQKVIPSA